MNHNSVCNLIDGISKKIALEEKMLRDDIASSREASVSTAMAIFGDVAQKNSVELTVVMSQLRDVCNRTMMSEVNTFIVMLDSMDKADVENLRVENIRLVSEMFLNMKILSIYLRLISEIAQTAEDMNSALISSLQQEVLDSISRKDTE